VHLATFTQEYKNLLERSVTVQVTQLTNLFKMIFSTEPENKEDDGPLNRLMSLYVFPPKITKGHLNTTFQSNELKLAAMYKSTSINPFLYAPQTDQASVLVVQKDFDLERNKKSFAIREKDCKQVSSHIKGIGKINTMDDVAMTCANICGIQLAIIDISPGKPLLYQFAWKLDKFIENKKFYRWHARNAQSLFHLPLLFMAKLHQFFMHLTAFSRNSLNTNKVEHGITSGDQGLNIKKCPLWLNSRQSF
jgi:hypothetical protein